MTNFATLPKVLIPLLLAAAVLASPKIAKTEDDGNDKLSNAITWGSATNGLQAGFLLREKTAHIELYIRNVSSGIVSGVVLPPPLQRAAVELRDSSGRMIARTLLGERLGQRIEGVGRLRDPSDRRSSGFKDPIALERNEILPAGSIHFDKCFRRTNSGMFTFSIRVQIVKVETNAVGIVLLPAVCGEAALPKPRAD